jgi:uracil-DNA glycosylase
MTDRLDQLLAAVRACRVCRTQPQGTPLPHEPRPILQAQAAARIAIYSQAPGLRAHVSGIPFSDASGDRLRAWMGVTPAEFYDPNRIAIVPMGFCFPGYSASKADLPPRRECAPLWRARVLAGLPHLQLVLLVGGYAMRWHLPGGPSVTMTHHVQGWASRLAVSDQGGASLPAVVALPHPSWRTSGWLKANSWFETELVPVLRDRVRAVLR